MARFNEFVWEAALWAAGLCSVGVAAILVLGIAALPVSLSYLIYRSACAIH